VGVHAWWRRRSPPRTGPRIVSWNLRNFSGRTEATSRHAPGHDLERLAGHLEALDADVYCLQEVLEPSALEPLLPGFRLEASEDGGAHGQRLVIARRAGHAATAAETDRCTALSPRQRPVLHQRVSLPSGELSLVVVHLKAGRRGFEVRQAQRAALLEFLRRVPPPRLVVGDFNTTGSSTLAPEAEITSLQTAFSAAGLHRVPPLRGCTAYWEGSRFDRFKEASTLDHVFVDGAGTLAPAVQVAPGTLCARHGCGPLTSTPAYPDIDYERVSDHCPLVIDVSA
jgi:endonuclease/exonuclease/phosphatase family metal-dependent hydrolase